ncbi:MAG: XdhC family protein [Verrucomicrobia bacterium]|nr:XdhC family protein [Verrucomicrobiota bacterium]
MLAIWKKVADELDSHYKVFLAIVVDHQKGSPGTARAQLLYTEAGEILGTIGGGIMEARLLEEAHNQLRSGKIKPTLRTLYHHPRNEDASGLICGGAQSLVTMVLDNDHRPIVHSLLNRLEHDQPGSLILSPSGLNIEEEDLNEPSTRFEKDGDVWAARLGLLNRRRVLVVGCGHCGAALARQMDMLGFQVTVVEPREELYTLRDVPSRVVKQFRAFSEAGQTIDHARLTFAVVMTPSYLDDVDALASLQPNPFPFIGVMGSPVKLKKIKGELLSRGISPSDESRICAPVGLPIESDTPEEIAVSIAAQILQKIHSLSFL